MSQSRTCGSCHQPVGANDVTCPHCGAWLAAYESAMDAPVSPEIAVPAVTSATAPVTPVTSSSSTAPRRSLMDDLLKQSQAEDDASDPAAELAEMAKGDSSFADQVEAELRDARVVIDETGDAVIQTAPDTVDVPVKPEPASGAKRVIPPSGSGEATVSPPTAAPTAKEPVTTNAGTTTQRAQTMLNPDWLPKPPNPDPGGEALRPRPATSTKRTNPIIIAVFVIFVLSMFRNAGAASFLVLALIIGVAFFWFALGISKSTGRSTGDMPLDQLSRKNRRKRR